MANKQAWDRFMEFAGRDPFKAEKYDERELQIRYKTGYAIWQALIWAFLFIQASISLIIVYLRSSGVQVNAVNIPLFYLLQPLNALMIIVAIVKIFAMHHYRKTL